VVIALVAGTTIGPPAVRAASYAHAQVCTGGAAELLTDGDFQSTLTCGSDVVLFQAPLVGTPTDLCAAAPQSLTFAGTETVNGSDPTPASWTLVGGAGVFLATTSSATGKGAGVWDITSGGSCGEGGAFGDVVLARDAPSKTAPTAFVCQALGSVDGIHSIGGRAGYSWTGTASGAGSCKASSGARGRTVSYSGTWLMPPCGTDWFDVDLAITTPSTGLVTHIANLWQHPSKKAPVLVEDESSSPIGAGSVSETPPLPCDPAVGSSFVTSATWAFVVA
jgi:hypothetical protein